MKRILRSILGIGLILCGVALTAAAISILVGDPSWELFIPMVICLAISYLLVNAGISVAKGREVREAFHHIFIAW